MTTKDCQVVIVSGRSGSGKTSVLNILEDLGYYPIDNLPLSSIPDVVDKLVIDSKISKVALGVDVRTPQADLTRFVETYDRLMASYGKEALKIIYVTAQESVLVARFDATRRVHPLMSTMNNLPNAIRREIELLDPIATRADILIDTSTLNIHQLKEQIRSHLGVDNVVTVNILSFGFKFGSPIDADFIYDVRVLPNPHWMPELRTQTGKDAGVIEFFSEYPAVEEMVTDIFEFFKRWLPEFLHNNRHTVTIAIGCTGGKHRSVFVAEQIGERLRFALPKEMLIRVKHREKNHWG